MPVGLEAPQIERGKGRGPFLGIGAQDESPFADLDRAQPAGAYLLICRLTADTVRVTKIFQRQSRRIHFNTLCCDGGANRDRICPPT